MNAPRAVADVIGRDSSPHRAAAGRGCTFRAHSTAATAAAGQWRRRASIAAVLFRRNLRLRVNDNEMKNK